MRKIVLSIKPKYVENILNGTKKYEYRKRITKEPINEIYIYATSPVSKIVAKFAVFEVIKLEPKLLWEVTKEFSGISEKEYFEYFANHDMAYAYGISNLYKLNKSICLKEFGINHPPQSYVYLKNIIDE